MENRSLQYLCLYYNAMSARFYRRLHYFLSWLHYFSADCGSGEMYHRYSEFGNPVRCFYLNGRQDADKRTWYQAQQACKYVTRDVTPFTLFFCWNAANCMIYIRVTIRILANLHVFELTNTRTCVFEKYVDSTECGLYIDTYGFQRDQCDRRSC